MPVPEPTVPLANQRCADCRFWRWVADRPGVCRMGDCRRYPPPWPSLPFNGWCGEWKSLPKPA